KTIASFTRIFEPVSSARRIEALRQRGVDAYPAYVPSYRLRVAGGAMPLVGVRRVRTLLGGGPEAWVSVYESDDYGFRNSRGLWRAAELALVGDSFAMGYGAADGQDIGSLLRAAYPRTVNAGMNDTGPLSQLAILREYLPLARPTRVVLLY